MSESLVTLRRKKNLPKKKGLCKICSFFQKYPYKLSEKQLFEKKAREGTSLRQLSLLLEAYGLKANKDTIARHLKLCMNVDVSTQRSIEKQLKREKISKGFEGVGQRIKKFFIKPTEVIEECPHSVTVPFFDMKTEQVYDMCQRCGKVIGTGRDPHTPHNKKKDLLILRRLRKR